MSNNKTIDIEKLGIKGEIEFQSDGIYNGRNIFDKLDTLLDGDTNNKSSYGCLLNTEYKNENGFIFKLFHTSNIYAYGNYYGDSSGYTPKKVSIFKKNEKDEFVLYKQHVPTKHNEWYLLFEKLNQGIYKISAESNYVAFTEWYVESIASKEFLLKDNDLYSIKNTILSQLKESEPTEELFKKYGFNDAQLLNLDKFYGQVQMKYEGKCCDGELFSYKIGHWIKNIEVKYVTNKMKGNIKNYYFIKYKNKVYTIKKDVYDSKNIPINISSLKIIKELKNIDEISNILSKEDVKKYGTCEVELSDELLKDIQGFQILKWTDDKEDSTLNISGKYKDKLFKCFENVELLFWTDNKNTKKVILTYGTEPYKAIDSLKTINDGKFNVLVKELDD